MALVSVVVALIGATLLTAMFVEPVTDLVYPRVEEKGLRAVRARYSVRRAGRGGRRPERRRTAARRAERSARRSARHAQALRRLRRRHRRRDEERDRFRRFRGGAGGVPARQDHRAGRAVPRVLPCADAAAPSAHARARPPFSRCRCSRSSTASAARRSLMEGALLIFLIVFLAPRLGVTWFADHAAGTHLLAWFLNNTPRSIIASLT